MRRQRLSGFSLALVAVLMLAASRPVAASTRQPLNRSVYVPVSFTLCPHLVQALLYVDERAVGTLPAERIFQFTYYPQLQRIEPPVIQVRVEGQSVAGGEPFLGRIAVTPGGIHTATANIPFHSSREVGQLRYKIDVRLQKVDLRIRCSDRCGRASTVAAAPTVAVPPATPQQP